MDYQANTITILTNSEFLMLLAAAGVEHWYGIDLTDRESLFADERRLNGSLASLYQKGLIDWKDGRASISERIRPVLRTLRDAAYCVIIRTESRSDRARSCYISSGEVVTVERRTASDDELELHMQNGTDWIEDIRESECFPVTAGEPEAGETVTAEAVPVSTFELMSVPGGMLIQTVKLYEHGLYALTETEDAGGTRSEIFSAEGMCALLREWIGGAA